MNFLRKAFLMAILLGASLVGRSQSLFQPVSAKEVFNDACGTRQTLPLTQDLQNFQSAGSFRLSCNFVTGEPLSAKIAELFNELKSSFSLKPQNDWKCDFVKPLDLKLLLEEKQQTLNKFFDDTFRK